MCHARHPGSVVDLRRPHRVVPFVRSAGPGAVRVSIRPGGDGRPVARTGCRHRDMARRPLPAGRGRGRAACRTPAPGAGTDRCLRYSAPPARARHRPERAGPDPGHAGTDTRGICPALVNDTGRGLARLRPGARSLWPEPAVARAADTGPDPAAAGAVRRASGGGAGAESDRRAAVRPRHRTRHPGRAAPA